MDTPVDEQQMFQNVTRTIAAAENEIAEANSLSLEIINDVLISLSLPYCKVVLIRRYAWILSPFSHSISLLLHLPMLVRCFYSRQ